MLRLEILVFFFSYQVGELIRTWFSIGWEKFAASSGIVVKEEIVDGNVSILVAVRLCTDVNLFLCLFMVN